MTPGIRPHARFHSLRESFRMPTTSTVRQEDSHGCVCLCVQSTSNEALHCIALHMRGGQFFTQTQVGGEFLTHPMYVLNSTLLYCRISAQVGMPRILFPGSAKFRGYHRIPTECTQSRKIHRCHKHAEFSHPVLRSDWSTIGISSTLPLHGFRLHALVSRILSSVGSD